MRLRPSGLTCQVLALMSGLAIVLAAAGRVVAAEKAAAPAKKSETGFTPLLQGDSHQGWIGYGQDKWPEGWEAKDGILHRTGAGGDIMTAKKYRDFDLRFGWKISPGGNSGVMYRVSQEKDPAYYTGPEYQVFDSAQDEVGPHTAGALYDLYAPTKNAVKPAGQWNRARIVVQGNRVRHFLNGQKVVDVELKSDDWNKRLAASKFASWPKFANNEEGHIVFQDHGNEVWYRNIRIKELTSPKSK